MEQSAQRALLFFSSCGENDSFGNPSSIHWAGRKAKSALDTAREKVAAAVGASDPDLICFTGSATEATNLAIKGFYFQNAKKKLRVITSRLEHEATLETCGFLQEWAGVEIQYLESNAGGQISLEQLGEILQESQSTTLVSLMAANNETGVIFPWADAARISKNSGALFHLDAVQALGKIPRFTLENSDVDLASFSAHKIGGPKGVGALYIRKGVALTSLIHGGVQERKRRAGTVNVAGIAAFGEAAATLQARDLGAVSVLRDFLESRVLERIAGAHIHGKKEKRLGNTSNFLFDNVRGEALIMGLDLEGFAVSSGSACNSGSILPSHVLLAMGLEKTAAQSAVRVSLAPSNAKAEIEEFVVALEKIVARIRAQKK